MRRMLIVHSSRAACVSVCVCFPSALMIRFSLRDAPSGDCVGHPRWEPLCSRFAVCFLVLCEQVNIFWGYCEVVPATMRVWNLLERETGSGFSFFFFLIWVECIYDYLFPFLSRLSFSPMGKRTIKVACEISHTWTKIPYMQRETDGYTDIAIK